MFKLCITFSILGICFNVDGNVHHNHRNDLRSGHRSDRNSRAKTDDRTHNHTLLEVISYYHHNKNRDYNGCSHCGEMNDYKEGEVEGYETRFQGSGEYVVQLHVKYLEYG